MPGRPVTDEEVLDWWEAYDAGLSINQVAKLYGRDGSTVHRHLHELGVTRSRGDDPPPDDERVLDLAIRHEEGRLSPEERRLWEAIAAIPRPDVGGDNERRGGLAYARSLDHTLPTRGAVVQSARQRRLDRWAGSYRKIIRGDLRRAGLMT